MRRTARLRVKGLSRRRTTATLSAGPLRLACAIGRSGCRVLKREGDGATPLGCFQLSCVLYRPDRRPRPVTGLPVRAIRPGDGWCDAPADRNYNRPVRLPYPASTERMWRDDPLYDLVVVLDHNARPRMRGAGSAIFMHVARPGLLSTEGCVALPAAHLARILARLRPGTAIHID
jgi:L,D-peptidoglycan transpeptidase YkuD (ErfK/YbiS/YcfS/YnhG family)